MLDAPESSVEIVSVDQAGLPAAANLVYDEATLCLDFLILILQLIFLL